MKFLLDTNIICENIKAKPHVDVAKFCRAIAPDDLYISVLSIGEVRKGIEKLNYNQEKRQKLQLWLEQDLVQFFSGRILPINIDVANTWGALLGKNKNPLPAIDSLIAATTICFHMTLVTRNTSDFAIFPLEIFNPWVTEHDMA